MGLFMVMFWCAILARGILRCNSRSSRFGVFNSRLGTKKFPFCRQGELASKGLICVAVCGIETALFENNRVNSRLYGNIRELRSALGRRLDQDVDGASGSGELAPGLVVDGHTVGDALGAGQALGVAGDEHRFVRVLRRQRCRCCAWRSSSGGAT